MSNNFEDRWSNGQENLHTPERLIVNEPHLAPKTAREKFISRDTATIRGEVSPRELLANEILKALPEADFLRVLPYLTPVALMAGEDLYNFAGGVRFVYFPESAVVSQLYVLANGHTAEAEMIGREGMVGLCGILNTSQRNFWTKVLIGGSALRIEVETLRQEFQRGAAMQQLLFTYTGARMAHLSHRAVCSGCHTIEQRLCSWLLMLHDRVGAKPLHLTHEQIADHLGVRRAGITAIAGSLKEQGAISYRRGLINILDRRLLLSAACECYALLGVNEHERRA